MSWSPPEQWDFTAAPQNDLQFTTSLTFDNAATYDKRNEQTAFDEDWTRQKLTSTDARHQASPKQTVPTMASTFGNGALDEHGAGLPERYNASEQFSRYVIFRFVACCRHGFNGISSLPLLLRDAETDRLSLAREKCVSIEVEIKSLIVFTPASRVSQPVNEIALKATEIQNEPASSHMAGSESTYTSILVTSTSEDSNVAPRSSFSIPEQLNHSIRKARNTRDFKPRRSLGGRDQRNINSKPCDRCRHRRKRVCAIYEISKLWD